MENRKPNRLPNYNYANTGYYFVTICTYQHGEWFGKVKNGEMILNKYGDIINEKWVWLAEQYSYVGLDEYIVMPNHIHGIIGINVGDEHGDPNDVGDGRDHPLHSTEQSACKIKPLPELIGAFKTTSSKLIHNAGARGFRWQRSFYDHVIHNESALNRMREYIVNNPREWDSDIENIFK